MYSSPMERIMKEYKDLSSFPLSQFGLSIGLRNNNDYTKWIFTLMAPRDSIYSGGYFKLYADFPNGYPSIPPEICFVNPIYHINVNDTVPFTQGQHPLGAICIGPLGFWKQNYTMRELICSIYSLFYYVNPSCAYNNNKANEYKNDRNTYETKVRYFVRKYASLNSYAVDFNRTHDWDFNVFT